MDLKVDRVRRSVLHAWPRSLVLVRSNFPRSFRAINIFEASFSAFDRFAFDARGLGLGTVIAGYTGTRGGRAGARMVGKPVK